jgi:hypothetical protein
VRAVVAHNFSFSIVTETKMAGVLDFKLETKGALIWNSGSLFITPVYSFFLYLSLEH